MTEKPDSIYTKPKVITDLSECHFYHKMDIPGYGLVGGEWDLRDDTYTILGKVDFKGKRVLDIGTANGFNCFYMEKQGADVIAYDLSAKQSWDIVPFAQFDYAKDTSWQKEQINKLNNGFWLAHNAYKSKSKMVNGSVYDIPPEIGPVDIAVYSAILIHFRDPFQALFKGLSLTRETVIVTGNLLNSYSLPVMWALTSLCAKLGISLPVGLYKPVPGKHKHGVWWSLTSEIIKAFIRILGFEDIKVYYHYKAKYKNRKKLCFTIVGRRTSGSVVE